MVLTGGQTTTFFENAAHMGIPHATVIQLQQEGIITVEDLSDFDKDGIEQLAANLRRPAGRIPDPNQGAAPGATIPTPAFEFGAKSQHRLALAAELIRYYEAVGRTVTLPNITWGTALKNFSVQWKALEEKKKGEKPDVPTISKALPVIKWSEAFRDYLHRVIGGQMAPLAYIIRDEAAVPTIGTIAADKPHSEEHGSIEDELIARASHDHPLYRDDNGEVYYLLEEATRGTPYAASIKPFQRAKDGRGAMLALTSQYAGNDKWEAEIKRHEQLLHTRVWKGQSNFTLDKFISQHRNAYVSMQAASEHVTYQLPNEHSRVGFLTAAIKCSDAGLQAAIAAINTDQTPDGLRNNFEAAAAHLLPYDPVQKKRNERSNGKRDAAEISDVSGEKPQISAFGSKQGRGHTGVHLRYHKDKEYRDLTQEQRDEIDLWRKLGKPKTMPKPGTKPPANGNKWKKGKPNDEQAMISAVNKAVADQLKAIKSKETAEAETEAKVQAYCMALLKKKGIKSTLSEVKAAIGDVNATPEVIDADAPTLTPTLKTSLKKIIQRAKIPKKGAQEN